MSAGIFERQHDQPRLQPRRLRELPPAPERPPRKPEPPRTRPHRKAQRTLLARVRAAAEQLGRAAGSEANAALGGAQLAQQALKLFWAGKRELHTDSPVALSHLLAWALQTSAAQQLTLAAADADLASDRGARLLEQAARAQGRAERASIAAASFASLLAKPRKTPTTADALADLVRNASKPREEPAT